MCNSCNCFKSYFQQYIIPPIVNIIFEYYVCIRKEVLQELNFPFHQIKSSKKCLHIGYYTFCYKTISFINEYLLLRYVHTDTKLIYNTKFWENLYENITYVYFTNVYKKRRITWNFVCLLNDGLYCAVRCVYVKKDKNKDIYVFSIYIKNTLQCALNQCRINMSKTKSEFLKMHRLV
jgi:hypothetical protein